MSDELLASQVNETVCVGAAVAEPVAVSVVAATCALLVNVRVELSAALATTGLYVTVNGTLCPAVMTFGSDKPLIVNSELLLLAAGMVTFAPVAVRLPVAVPLVPVNTFPTATGVGLTPNCPATVDPVPVREMTREGLEPFDVTVTLPLALAVDVGAKVTVKLVLCPAVSVTGVEIPFSVKPVPLIPTFEIITVEPPVLVTVSVSGSLVPVGTVPKLRLVGFAPSAPTAAPVPVNGKDSEGLGAFEVIVTLPLALPVVSGANETVNVVLCPALSASGVAMP